MKLLLLKETNGMNKLFKTNKDEPILIICTNINHYGQYIDFQYIDYLKVLNASVNHGIRLENGLENINIEDYTRNGIVPIYEVAGYRDIELPEAKEIIIKWARKE